VSRFFFLSFFLSFFNFVIIKKKLNLKIGELDKAFLFSDGFQHPVQLILTVVDG